LPLLLGLEQDGVKIGAQDNFFAIGGHSLLVMQVIAGLQQAGLTVNARLMFTHHQLSALAAAIDVDIKSDEVEFQTPANLIPADCAKITPAMLPLVRLTEQELQTIAAQVPGGDRNIQDIYPLGPLQQGILFHHMMHTGADPYVMPSLFKLSNRQALDGFLAGLQFVIDRHDVLRTAVLWEKLNQPVQVVYRQAQLPVSWLAVADGQDSQAFMQQLCQPHLQRMDLTQGPLFALKIAQQPGSEQFFVLL
jgi:hypothetical protein